MRLRGSRARPVRLRLGVRREQRRGGDKPGEKRASAPRPRRQPPSAGNGPPDRGRSRRRPVATLPGGRRSARGQANAALPLEPGSLARGAAGDRWLSGRCSAVGSLLVQAAEPFFSSRVSTATGDGEGRLLRAVVGRPAVLAGPRIPTVRDARNSSLAKVVCLCISPWSGWHARLLGCDGRSTPQRPTWYRIQMRHWPRVPGRSHQISTGTLTQRGSWPFRFERPTTTSTHPWAASYGVRA